MKTLRRLITLFNGKNRPLSGEPHALVAALNSLLLEKQMKQRIAWIWRLILGLILGTACLGAVAQDTAPQTKGAPRGKYILRLASGDSGFCAAFTGSLNQFRYLDFDTCNPRLSPKYPQLSRPQWKEIPLNMDLAKKIITTPPSIGWERWLKVTEAARAAGQVKMWRIRVDLFGDGQLETLVRLDHTGTGERPYCPYFDRYQIVMDATDPERAKVLSAPYMRYWLGNDMIYDASTKRYYLLDWNWVAGSAGHGEDAILGKDRDFKDIGATASVMVYKAHNLGVGPVCWIDWVPTGHRK